MKKIIGLITLSFLLVQLGFAQQNSKYWIFLKDKPTTDYDYRNHLSERAIQNRILLQIPLIQYTDMPLNSSYTKQIADIEGISIKNYSKWLNAIAVETTQDALKEAMALPFVEGYKRIQGLRCASVDKAVTQDLAERRKGNEYSLPLVQMGIEDMNNAKLNGEGIILGVIDAGFHNAHNHRNLKHLFESKSILDTRDFVNPQRSKDVFFSEAETNDDDHGTNVLEMIAGTRLKNEAISQQGFAHKAKFYLARTDHGAEEKRREEDNWLRAIEWMDSLGIRLINSSLGYATGFDDADENYKTSQIDGKTAITTKAANIAFTEKGILLVSSAGNEGDDPNWRILSSPSDALNALSIGAIADIHAKQSYSSVGPESLGYMKPNVSCFSATGTSFSAPAVAGFAACLLQKKPDATNKELFEVIEKSASLYPYGNNYIGYGVPIAKKAIALLENNNRELETYSKQQRVSKSGRVTLKVKAAYNSDIVVFHKKDKIFVIKQESYQMKKDKAIIEKYEDAAFSTVIINNSVIEIEWK